jgi:hypothetical protein
MSDDLIEFEWWRDAAGYRLTQMDVVAELPNVKTDTLVWWAATPEADSGMRIVRMGGDLKPYRPMVVPMTSVLFIMFAKYVNQPSTVLAFIERFGPLTRDGLNPEIGESVTKILNHADAMRSVLLASMAMEGRSGTPIIGPIRNLGEEASPLVGVITAMNAKLVLEPDSIIPKLKLHPTSLLDLLWLQLRQTLSREDIAVRECQHCGVWFVTGGTTGRRIDAKFCSVEHRTLFNNQKRSREK